MRPIDILTGEIEVEVTGVVGVSPALWYFRYIASIFLTTQTPVLGGCRAKSSQTDRHKVIELVDDGYKTRSRHIQVRSTEIRACGNKNQG